MGAIKASACLRHFHSICSLLAFRPKCCHLNKVAPSFTPPFWAAALMLRSLRMQKKDAKRCSSSYFTFRLIPRWPLFPSSPPPPPPLHPRCICFAKPSIFSSLIPTCMYYLMAPLAFYQQRMNRGSGQAP